MAVYGISSIAATSVVFLGRGPLPLGDALLIALGLVPMPLFLTLRAVIPTSRFLSGLREGGMAYDVLVDEVDWFGDRRLVVRAEGDEWHIVTRNRASIHLEVRGPRMPKRVEVRGEWRRAGRIAAMVGAVVPIRKTAKLAPTTRL